MKKMIFSLWMMLVMGASTAHAGIFDLMYVKAQVGLPVVTDGSIDGTDIDTSFDPPYPITLGFGVYMSPLTSLALEVNYETAELTDLPPSMLGGSDDMKQFGALLNFYFHFPALMIVEPFAGVGLGYSIVTIDNNDYDGKGFIWQISAGVDINLKEFMALTAEARLLEPISIDIKDGGGVDVGELDYTHARLMVGLKFKL
ncbi:MAG: porin family protein [Bdellovibrionaceae bacterium]|nr:porin family protein [Pseudobdellovibrionaceae bacterium]